MNAQATYSGQLVDVIAKTGGWSTILLDSGATRKVRNGQLSAVATAKDAKRAPAPKADALSGFGSAATKDAKPAKVRKPKVAKPKREVAGIVRLTPKLAERYHQFDDVPTASGRPSVDIADPVADMLRGEDLQSVYRAASEATGRTQKDLKERYERLNPGMQRMNLGNLIRGAAKAAEKAKEKDARAATRATAKAKAKDAKAAKKAK